MQPTITQDAAFISANAASYIASTYTTTSKDVKGPGLVLEAECLKSLNAFLDYFLAIVIRDAKSTDLQDLKGTLALLLDSALGYVALNEAQAELETYRNQETGAGRKFEFSAKKDANGMPEVFDVESIWLQARIRCMIYSTVGEKEESDFPALSDDDTPVTPPVAIFLTAVLEFLGEHILLTSGRFARDRLGSNVQGTLNQNDLERGIKMDKALNAIWSDYQAIIPTVTQQQSRNGDDVRNEKASRKSEPIVAQSVRTSNAHLIQELDQHEQKSVDPAQEPVVLRKASPALADGMPTIVESQEYKGSRRVSYAPSEEHYMSELESMMNEPAITAMSTPGTPAMPTITETKSLKAIPSDSPSNSVAPLNLTKKITESPQYQSSLGSDLAPALAPLSAASSAAIATESVPQGKLLQASSTAPKVTGAPPALESTQPLTNESLAKVIASPNSEYSPQPTPRSTTSSVYNNVQPTKSPGLWSRTSGRSSSTAEIQQATLWRKAEAEAEALAAQAKHDGRISKSTSLDQASTSKAAGAPMVISPQDTTLRRVISPGGRSTGVSSSRWSQISAEDESPDLAAATFDPDAYQWKSRRMQIPASDESPQFRMQDDQTLSSQRSPEVSVPATKTSNLNYDTAKQTDSRAPMSISTRKPIDVGITSSRLIPRGSPNAEPLKYSSPGHSLGLALRDMSTTEPDSDYGRFIQSEQLRESLGPGDQPSARDTDLSRQRIIQARDAAFTQPAQSGSEKIEGQKRYDDLLPRTPPLGLIPTSPTQQRRASSNALPRSATTSPGAPSQTMQLAQFLRNTGPVRNTPKAVPLLAAAAAVSPSSEHPPKPIQLATAQSRRALETPPGETDDGDSYHDVMYGSGSRGPARSNRGESLAEFLNNVPPPPSLISDPQSNGAQRLPPLSVASSRTAGQDDSLIAGPAYGTASGVSQAPIESRMVSSSSMLSRGSFDGKKTTGPLLGRPLGVFTSRSSSTDVGAAPMGLSQPSSPTEETSHQGSEGVGKINWPAARRQNRMTSRSAVAVPYPNDEEDEDEDDLDDDEDIYGKPRRKPKQRESLVDFLRDTAPPGFDDSNYRSSRNVSGTTTVGGSRGGSRVVSQAVSGSGGSGKPKKGLLSSTSASNSPASSTRRTNHRPLISSQPLG